MNVHISVSGEELLSVLEYGATSEKEQLDGQARKFGETETDITMTDALRNYVIAEKRIVADKTRIRFR